MSKGKKITLIVVLVILALCLVTAAGLLIFKPKFLTYHQAEKMIKKGEYSKAIATLYKLGDYKDSREKLSDLTAEERYFAANDYAWSVDECSIIGLDSDGNIKIATSSGNPNGYYNKKKGKDLVAITAGDIVAIGLKEDGTAISLTDYKNANGTILILLQDIDVNDWENVAKIDSCLDVAAGVKENGEVVFATLKRLTDIANDALLTGEQKDNARRTLDCVKEAKKWENIADISVGVNMIVGLKTDGTVVATPEFSSSNESEDHDDIENWENIVAVVSAPKNIMGLKADGTIVMTNENIVEYEDVKDWEDIVAISGKYTHFVGLKADGTVVAVNLYPNAKEACDVEDWENIIAVHAGFHYTLGLKADGSIVYAGDLPEEIKAEIEDWNLFE